MANVTLSVASSGLIGDASSPQSGDDLPYSDDASPYIPLTTMDYFN